MIFAPGDENNFLHFNFFFQFDGKIISIKVCQII